ncbi:hypothetical protein J2X36_004507 [Methylobacterium sp. BE186]|uniref:hypothetical protein n=1 Tax=Methylobacterium sp. BE186 TaxID=2817715 RepID=UPI002862FAB8|nr:hypothetical protein [Methylobacterium sp. BE186]MDR7039729.1 hypothetical protein [Methylobacterium sp. BE186]
MAEPPYRRLPGTHYDAWLIKTSQEVIERSRALLERTKLPAVAQPTEPAVSSQANKTQPK